MKIPILIFVTIGLALSTSIASASGPTTPEQKHLQPNAPRTIIVSEADTPPMVRAGLLQSTLILLPDQEKVANVFAGDTVDWVFDGGHVASRFISISFEFLLAIPHLSHLVCELGESTLQVISKLIQSVFDALALQDFFL